MNLTNIRGRKIRDVSDDVEYSYTKLISKNVCGKSRMFIPKGSAAVMGKTV